MSLETIRVLLVANHSEHAEKIVRCLEELAVDLTAVEDCRKARELLSRRPAPSVVITATSLPDGNWCDVLRAIVSTSSRSAVVVYCAVADERLWSEAIWRGAYDLLVGPFDADQVGRCVEGAHRSSGDLAFHQTG